MTPSRERLALAVLMTSGFALRLGTALALPNLHYPDEIFQTLEAAHRLAFGNGIVSWEWRTGARNWLFPGFQFLPPNLQARIGARWPLTWAGRVSYDVALGHALEVELLGRTQLRYYFPDAAILRERVAGLTKSLIATR